MSKWIYLIPTFSIRGFLDFRLEKGVEFEMGNQDNISYFVLFVERKLITLVFIYFSEKVTEPFI